MPTTSEYLQQLQTDKQNLVDNLVTKGVSATSDETFTSLVPKVLDIQTGGSDLVIDDASYLFYNGVRLNALYELLNACQNVSDCASMFYRCSELIEIDLSNFDTSNVNNMSSMFYNCSKLTNINVSNFNTIKVTNMGNMFYFCSKLQKIDISSFSSENLGSSGSANMFNYCSNLNQLIINNQNLFKMTNTNMLANTPIASGTGFVYVPDDMVETYKSATNWSVYADQIKGISELPEEA